MQHENSLQIHTHTESALIICKSCICKFANMLKLICKPPISQYSRYFHSPSQIRGRIFVAKFACFQLRSNKAMYIWAFPVWAIRNKITMSIFYKDKNKETRQCSAFLFQYSYCRCVLFAVYVVPHFLCIFGHSFTVLNAPPSVVLKCCLVFFSTTRVQYQSVIYMTRKTSWYADQLIKVLWPEVYRNPVLCCVSPRNNESVFALSVFALTL